MNNSYTKERLNLAALYFSIILVIVGIFSFIVLHQSNQQLRRLDRFKNNVPRPIENVIFNDQIKPFEVVIEEIRKEDIKSILLLDFIILFSSSFISYYLAGKTLEPILNALDKQKRFVSDASHELKTPLANIKLEAEVLNRSKKTNLEEYKEFTTNVLSDVDRLNDLVTYMLNAARNENEASKLTNETLNLKDIINQVKNDFKEVAKSKNINLVAEIENKDIKIITDKKLFIRLLSILVDNAIKYSKKDVAGKVTLKASQLKSNKIVVEVIDEGVGIDSKDLPRVFDRFYRASEDRSEKGFGLGLSIAKQLAEDLDMEISVKSKVDVGTVFRVSWKG